MTKINYDYEGWGTAIDFPSYLYYRWVFFEEKTMQLCFFLKDINTIISPESRGRTTHNTRIRQQGNSVINILEWNLNRVFTEEVALQLRTRDNLQQVSLVKYQKSGNDANMKLDENLDSDSSMLSIDENLTEQEKDKEEEDDELSSSNDTEIEDEQKQPTKQVAKTVSPPTAKNPKLT